MSGQNSTFANDIRKKNLLKVKKNEISRLGSHLLNIADQHNLKVMKGLRNRNKTCPYCYSPWESDTTSLKLLPSKKLKFFQKKKSKITEKETNETPQLNKLRNTLMLKCKVCLKKSLFSLVKKHPVRGTQKEDIVEVTKKKKKKKDKYCGLIVNLSQTETPLSECVISKKNKRAEAEKTKELDSGNQSGSQKNILFPKSKSKLKIDSTKNLLPNPFAQPKVFKRKDIKLQRLKLAMKQNKGQVKKTLKDFLTLV